MTTRISTGDPVHEIPYIWRQGSFAQHHMHERIVTLNLYVQHRMLVALTEDGEKVVVKEISPSLDSTIGYFSSKIHFNLTQLSNKEYKAYWNLKLFGSGVASSKESGEENTRKPSRYDLQLQEAIDKGQEARVKKLVGYGANTEGMLARALDRLKPWKLGDPYAPYKAQSDIVNFLLTKCPVGNAEFKIALARGGKSGCAENFLRYHSFPTDDNDLFMAFIYDDAKKGQEILALLLSKGSKPTLTSLNRALEPKGLHLALDLIQAADPELIRVYGGLLILTAVNAKSDDTQLKIDIVNALLDKNAPPVLVLEGYSYGVAYEWVVTKCYTKTLANPNPEAEKLSLRLIGLDGVNIARMHWKGAYETYCWGTPSVQTFFTQTVDVNSIRDDRDQPLVLIACLKKHWPVLRNLLSNNVDFHAIPKEKYRDLPGDIQTSVLLLLQKDRDYLNWVSSLVEDIFINVPDSLLDPLGEEQLSLLKARIADSIAQLSMMLIVYDEKNSVSILMRQELIETASRSLKILLTKKEFFDGKKLNIARLVEKLNQG